MYSWVLPNTPILHTETRQANLIETLQDHQSQFLTCTRDRTDKALYQANTSILTISQPAITVKLNSQEFSNKELDTLQPVKFNLYLHER
jgi:hypothetical protein